MCLSIAVAFPERIELTGKHAGHEFAIQLNTLGFRCGYVKVEPGHPWHGKNYGHIDADCHGSLTFSEADVQCDATGPDDGWWVGFDCGHLGDKPEDAYASRFTPYIDETATCKSLQYVEAECKRLCEQAAEVAT